MILRALPALENSLVVDFNVNFGKNARFYVHWIYYSIAIEAIRKKATGLFGEDRIYPFRQLNSKLPKTVRHCMGKGISW